MKTGSSRPGIGKTAGVAIGVMIVIAVLAGVELAFAPTNKTTTAPTSTSSASGPSGALAIAVSKLTIDKTSADAPSGYTAYIYDVTVTDVGGADCLISPAGFKAVSATNAAYNTSVALGARQPLTPITLSPGASTSGQVSFQLPNGEQPVRLEYRNATELVDVFATNLPQPSRWVSAVVYANATLRGAEQNDYLVFVSIQSSVPFYYSTDKIVVAITLQAFTPNATGINVTSVAVSNQGFSIVKISPALPVAVPSDGTKVSLTLELSLPQTSVDVQELGFVVSTSQ